MTGHVFFFTDESRFSLKTDFRRFFICRKRGSCNGHSNVREHYTWRQWLTGFGLALCSTAVHHSTSSTGAIWMSCALQGRDPRALCTVFNAAVGPQFLLMDHNATCHRDQLVNEFLQREDISWMDWPATSPDLNPIETAWDCLGRLFAARPPARTL